MFKLYTAALFERGNTDGFGGFRPKNALFYSKKVFAAGKSAGKMWWIGGADEARFDAECGGDGRKRASGKTRKGASFGGKSWLQSWLQGFYCCCISITYVWRATEFNSTRRRAESVGQRTRRVPNAGSESVAGCASSGILRRWARVKRRCGVWTMDNTGGGARRATGWQWRILRASAVWTYGQCVVCWASGFRQGGERASGRATAAMRGFGRASGKGARRAFGALGACSRRCNLGAFGLRRSAVRSASGVSCARRRAAPVVFGRGGGGSQNTPLLLKQMRLGVGKFSRISGFGSGNPKFDSGEKRYGKNPQKQKDAPSRKPIQNSPASRGAYTSTRRATATP